MNRAKTPCIALAVYLLSPVAHATLIDAGDSTIDTSTGLEWLDLGLTADWSILDTEASAFFGPYRWATESEILGLFEYVSGPGTRTAGDSASGADAAQWARASELIGLLGPSGNVNGFYIMGVSREVFLGNDGAGDLYGRGYMRASSDGVSWDSLSPSRQLFYETDSRPGIGSWLVRTVAVSEPDTLALFGLGMVALAVSRRRRKGWLPTG